MKKKSLREPRAKSRPWSPKLFNKKFTKKLFVLKFLILSTGLPRGQSPAEIAPRWCYWLPIRNLTPHYITTVGSRQLGGSEPIQKFLGTFCTTTILEYRVERGGGAWPNQKVFMHFFPLTCGELWHKSAQKVLFCLFWHLCYYPYKWEISISLTQYFWTQGTFFSPHFKQTGFIQFFGFWS